MIYKKFGDKSLSMLGMGAMRLPVIDGNDSMIDRAAVEEMVSYAIESGINYFDTAWGYHSGNSETVMGEALSQHPRASFFLADKFPGYDLSNMDKVEEIFEEQLKKCGVSYFDFYLFHNVCEINIEHYLDDDKYGIFSYLKKQKENGRIRHLGFSVHGSYSVMKRFLEAYGEYMEFGQVQLNYLDWTFQDAKSKAGLLKQYNIPVWVMEPLRGGRLAKLSDSDAQRLSLLRPDESAAGWAFRYLQSIPGVTMILSGMSDIAQLKANIETFDTDSPLTEKEMAVLLSVADGMQGGNLPCTSCRYCTSHCPQQLDIPSLLQLYNEHSFTGGGFLAPMALAALPKDKRPAACLGCRKCEAVCPQQIKIAGAMSDFVRKLAR